MNQKLTKKLREKYPVLFAGLEKPLKESLMAFGLECNDGWHDLIDRNCALIVRADPNAELFQLKEKLGGLRMYFKGTTDEALDIAEEAERESFTICETCGKSGKLRDYGWLKTLCEDCWNKLCDERGIDNGTA